MLRSNDDEIWANLSSICCVEDYNDNGSLVFIARLMHPLVLHLQQPRIYGHYHSAGTHQNCTDCRAEKYAIAVQNSGCQGDGEGVVARCPNQVLEHLGISLPRQADYVHNV